MKKLLPVLAGLLFYTFCLQEGLAQDQSFEESVAAFQEEKNNMFADSALSPLADEERTRFDGLPFYEADPEFRVQAQFERVDGKVLEMATTTDRIARYRPYGKLRFELAGDTFELTVFQNVSFPEKKTKEPAPLFLPFTDMTNGDTTYGGGRYIDLVQQKGKRWTVDFNKAYNPYCAYNARYSCPIPPRENHLDTRIEAGVKYHPKNH